MDVGVMVKIHVYDWRDMGGHMEFGKLMSGLMQVDRWMDMVRLICTYG